MLRNTLIKLAHDNPKLRIYLIPLLRKASKSPTEEGAKKLFDEYRDSLKNPSHKTTVRWQDFLKSKPKKPLQHYRVVPTHLNNDLAEQWATYLRDGSYWEETLEYVPTEKIDFDSWHPGRHDYYTKAFQEGKAAKPVRLAPLSNGRYSVEDGNHRAAVSKDMGYPTVPAITTREIKGKKPSASPPSNLYEKVFGGEMNGSLIGLRSNLNLGMDFSLDWGDVAPTGYWMKVTDERIKPYQTSKLEIVADGDKRSADFKFHGKHFTHQWDKADHKSLVEAFVPFMEKAWKKN